MPIEFKNQMGATTAAEGVIGARPFRIAGGGSKVADMFVARARDGRRVGTAVSATELVDERVDRRVGVDSFSIKFRGLFGGKPTKESPGLFAEEIGESEFVVNGGWVALFPVGKGWFVVDGRGETGRDGGSETERDGGSETGGDGAGETRGDGAGETRGDGAGETRGDGAGETPGDGAGDTGRGGSEMRGEGGGDTGREGGSELRRDAGPDTSAVEFISTCGL